MSDLMKLEPEHIKLIRDLFGANMSELNTKLKAIDDKLNEHVTVQKIRDNDQEEKDRRMNEVFTAALSAVEAAHDIKRSVGQIPETIHREMMECVEPRIETVKIEIKSVNDKVEAHLKDHDKTTKLYRRSLIAAIASAIVLGIIAVCNYLGIKLPGGKP